MSNHRERSEAAKIPSLKEKAEAALADVRRRSETAYVKSSRKAIVAGQKATAP